MHNFKKALKTSVLFCLTVILLYCAIAGVYFYGAVDYFQDYKERNDCAGTIDFLFIGSSQCQRGFRPDVADEELGVTSYNLASPSLYMEGRLEMVRREIERNPVKTIVFEVSQDTFNTSDKTHKFEGSAYIVPRLPSWPDRFDYVRRVFSPSDYSRLLAFYLEKGVKGLKFIAQGRYRLRQDPELWIKGYKKYETTPYRLADGFDYVEELNTKKVGFKPNKSEEALFEELAELCREKDIRLIMVSTAVSEKYICLRKGLDKGHKYYQELADRLEIPYVDLRLLKNRREIFSENEDFFDQIHLFQTGAEKNTRAFDRIYTMMVNGEDWTEMLYDSFAKYKEHQDYVQEYYKIHGK